MDDLLPSYESAVQQDPWILIAPYFTSEDLCSAALVSRKWHGTFTPSLWGSPASHFGVQNDTVYVALTRFKRTLPYVRPFVRELTHTLRFPPAHAEIYGGPHAEWLRDCFEYLPRLQCLIVNGLPFFDHASLLNLRYSSLHWKTTRPTEFPVFALRLLDASSCTNTTSIGLAEALPHFPDLVSLDLSRTLAAKNETVLNKLNYLRNLRVLTLQGLGLKDSDFTIVARSIGTRVRSLDVSHNHLSDVSARTLLEHCMKEPIFNAHAARGPLPPVSLPDTEGTVGIFENEDLVAHLRKKLTQGFVGRLAVEAAADVGVTHLYLSRNSMTVEGISGLLRSRRLQVLDIGHLSAVLKNPSRTPSGNAADDLELPGVSKLASVLLEYASAKLKYLRVNFELVTEDAPHELVPSLRAELSSDLGRNDPSNTHELDAGGPRLSEFPTAENTIVELSGDFTYPVELPGSRPYTLYLAGASSSADGLSSSTRNARPTPTIEIMPDSQNIKELVQVTKEAQVRTPLTHVSPPYPNNDNEMPLLDVGGYLLPSIQNDERKLPLENTKRGLRHNSINFVEDRRARLDLRQSLENHLHPGMLPKVHTLVLTDVPSTTTDKRIINRIIQYIRDAAEETYIAKQRARHTYILPPGRSRTLAEREYAHDLFALRRIVLEMATPAAVSRKISSWRSYPTQSSTEDADSEAFWKAATYDFSFFDDEECGIPGHDQGRTVPSIAMSGLQLAPTSPELPQDPTGERDPEPRLDVVGEIGKFRGEKKAVYNMSLQTGEVDPEVEGYWPGDITILRKPVNADIGDLDCYGNRYEAGWYYR